ncbi:MAG: helix-turn-helix transcriptional regulator [Anaerotignum sp.]|nr:helix-turn-helix transcriptional regulator [Anaerotignum sp.]
MLGLKIKEYLVSNGITQAFVSGKTGISAPTLCAMLNGERKILAEEYFLICKALNLDFAFFYRESEKAS